MLSRTVNKALAKAKIKCLDVLLSALEKMAISKRTTKTIEAIILVAKLKSRR